MEHWGLITYREAALLFNQLEVSTYAQQIIAEVVAHELIHNVSASYVSSSHDKYHLHGRVQIGIFGKNGWYRKGRVGLSINDYQVMHGLSCVAL